MFLVIMALAGFSSACGGSTATTSAPTDTSRAVTKEDLAVMPLSQSELGSEFLSFPVDSGSGYQTSAKVADNTTDPSDTPADIENAGWVASYGLDYSDPSLNALSTGHGAFDIRTEVDLFKDDQSAGAFLQKQLADEEKYKGQALSGGFTLKDASQFDVAAGDQGFGLKEQVDLRGTTGYGWIAGFRLGRLIASVQISRGDNSDVTTTIVQLTKVLEQHVNNVLEGKVTATAVPLPTKTPSAIGQAPRPDHGPYPDAMALTVGDLRKGTTVDQEGYVPDASKVSFERKFNPGGTGLLGLENDIDRYSRQSNASTTFDGLQALFTSGSAKNFFNQVFKGSSLPFQLSNTTVNETQVSAQGDGSFAVIASYDSPVGRVENEFVFIRAGSVIATLIFTELPDNLQAADVDALVIKMMSHINQELSKA
jgi:hypothetical protein